MDDAAEQRGLETVHVREVRDGRDVRGGEHAVEALLAALDERSDRVPAKETIPNLGSPKLENCFKTNFDFSNEFVYSF